MPGVKLIGLDALQLHLSEMDASLAAAPRAIVQQVAREAKALMQEEAPVRTGRLREGIHYRTSTRAGAAEATFWDDMDYTPFVIEGTRPHLIEAGFYSGRGRARWLRFESRSGIRFARRVHHPGTKANDFPARALDRLMSASEAILEATGAAIVAGKPPAEGGGDSG